MNIVTNEEDEVILDSDLNLNKDFNLFRTLSEGNNIDNPYIFYKKLREFDPVFYMQSSAGFLSENMWVITKYADINKVLASKKFGRSTNTVTDSDPGNKRVNAIKELKQNWVTFLDPPYHTRVRGFINKTFTTKLVNDFKPRIESIADFLIDCFEDDGEFELKNDFAYPLAAISIAEIMGIPAEDRIIIRNWAHKLVKVLDGVALGLSTDEIQQMYDAAEEVKDYFGKIVSEKAKAPGNDLISALIDLKINDDRLSELEVSATAALMIIDAHESIKNLIGNGLYALLQNPDQLELLRTNPELAENAVDEFLRYDSPGQFTGRRAMEDFELGGKMIAKGSQVVCMLGAGNRDPERYDNPDKLDIKRERINPLSFGGGIHYCAGAMLSKVEGEIGFKKLLERLPNLRLKKDEEYHFEKTYHGRGLKSLELRF
ncbi:MAG: cytochrome P450 [Ignavibacteriae bacterium]|nr:cytochrome P450 [Ignavibacteriota bacterium]